MRWAAPPATELDDAGTPWPRAGRRRRHGPLREALLLAHGPLPVEQLFGVRPEILDEPHTRGIPTQVYVPYGPEWYRYWLRRVAESRGA